MLLSKYKCNMKELKFKFDRRQVADELKQNQAITDSLINKILYSKRLLVDHVEALEQCMRYMQDSKRAVCVNKTDSKILNNNCRTELFTARNTCLLLGSTILEHFITPRSLRWTLIPSLLLTSGFGAMYIVKNVFVCRNKIVERELDQLIRTIDEFGNCIRRNMTYFQEIIIMKQQELIESRQIERAWDCITAAKEVTEILYEATRKLETEYPMPAKYSQYYAAMEELRDCEYFKNNVTDYSPKHIRDFHNIFAYVQSQFLLCLALTISTKPSISKLNEELIKIDCLLRQLVHEEENHFKNLAIEMNKKKQLEIDELNTSKAMQQRSGPIGVLQDSSLKLSACMVAVAAECQNLDITLQRLTEAEAEKKDDTKPLIAVANNMRGIESALSTCFDDFQRLMLVYNKFLNSKLNEANGNEKYDSTKSPQMAEFPESILRVEISQNQNDPQQGDDFFAYMYDAHDAEQLLEEQLSRPTHDMEILNFEKRITKGKFKPVLQQLKNRIDPIRQVMLDKEREVLAAKGINVDELFGKGAETKQHTPSSTQDNRLSEESECNHHQQQQQQQQKNSVGLDSDDDSVGSADLQFEQRSKKLKERDNFAEMRNFLAQKQTINLFGLDAPALPKVAGEEELLESEC